MSGKQKKLCGHCARFKVPNSGCPWAEDVRTGTIKVSDEGCEEFYQRPEKQKEKKIRKQLKDSGFSTHGCFEAIYSDGKPRFLLKNSDEFSLAETVDLDDEKYFPKEAKNVPYEPYGYYEGPLPNREELFRKVRNEFETWVDVEPIWKDVWTTCVLLSYHQEKLQTVPYLFLYGDNESGKSTVLQVLKSLSYRPMYGVTIPSADLYGYLEDSDGIGSILEDEVQGIQKDTDKIKIYKSGYKQGAVVPRTLMTQFDRIIKYYHTFCIKGCASEQIPQVKGFNERFLFTPMVEGIPQKEWADLSHDDIERLRNLRNMLLKWRMAAREWELPDVEMPFKGRLKELWKSILQISHGLSIHDTLFNFVRDQQNERLSGKQNTLEGHIVKVIVDLHNEAKVPVSSLPFPIIWMDLAHELGGKLDDNKPHVMDTGEFFKVTKNKVGYRLREILSGQTKVQREKDSEGNWISTKAYVFNPEKLRRIAKKYGYELVTKLPTLPSSQSILAPESMDIEREKNVENRAQTPQELGKVSNLVTNDLLIPCPFCKGLSKNMFFVCDTDLAAHVQASHTGHPEYVR
jgi:hypothetical protein